MSLSVRNLYKYYGKQAAVKDLDLTFEAGRIYGLLGRNGAGKSTILKLLASQLTKSVGQIVLDGEDIGFSQDSSQRIFLVSEEQWLPNWNMDKILKEALLFYPNLDKEWADLLCRSFGLDCQKKIMSLSTGYRSIAKFILAFSLPVDYVLLDEPTLGLDAGHRQLFHRYLLETHMRRPRTMILASHQIEEVAPLLEEIVLIDGGAVQLVASAEDIKGQVHRLTGPQDLLEEVAKGLIILSSQVLGKMKQVIVYGPLPQNLPNEIKISGLTLQDCFIQLTQREEEVR